MDITVQVYVDDIFFTAPYGTLVNGYTKPYGDYKIVVNVNENKVKSYDKRGYSDTYYQIHFVKHG